MWLDFLLIRVALPIARGMYLRAVVPWSTEIALMYIESTSTCPFDRSVALASALRINLATGFAAARRVNLRMFSADPTGLPLTSEATSATFRGAIRSDLRCALDSIASYLTSAAARV